MLEKLRARHIFGILASIVGATLLSLIPFSVYIRTPFDITAADAAPVAIFFVFVLGFLMNNALLKGERFKKNLNLELSRLRRIFHLAKNLGSSAADKKFFTKIKRAVYSYFDIITTRGLQVHQNSNQAFRQISYAVYSFKPRGGRQEIIYKEMLETLREAAASRQEINSILAGGITSYGWTVLFSMELLVVVATLLAQGDDVKNFVVTSATLSTIFIVTLLVWEVDHYSHSQLRELGRRYGQSRRSLEKRK